MALNQKIGVKAVQFALVLLAGSSMFAAHAQQSPETDAEAVKEPTVAPKAAEGNAQVAKVLITGSNIKTIDAETASPVQIIKRDDIIRLGVTNVSDIIGSISASTGGLSDIGSSNSFAPGASNASLRNLGTQSTLVLVNGRRIATYGFADFTEVFSNLDAIPIDAVDHVEILKSGASAIYGSDAVAGVINIITRQNYQGVEVNADAQRSLQSKTFGTKKASITAGFGDYDTDGYNILVNADLFKRDNVMWTNLLQYTNPTLAHASAGFGKYSSYSTPGNIIDGSESQPVAGCAQDLIIGGLCKYNRYDRFQAVPESQRGNFYTSATLNLGGGTQGFAEVSLSKSMTRYLNAFATYGDSLPGGGITWGNPSTGQPLTFNYLGLSAYNALNPTASQYDPTLPHDDGVGFRYRFADSKSYNNVDGTQNRIIAGLRGNFKEYEWESAVGTMGSKVVSNQQGQFSSSGFIKEIGDYNNYYPNTNPDVQLAYTAADPFFFNQPNGYHPGQANSAAVINTLFPVFSSTGKTQAEFIDGKITGPLTSLPAGMVNFALGGELRHESMNLGVSNNLQTGDIVGYGTSTADSSRSIESMYAEILIPVVKDLEVTTALRMDKYPNLSAHLSPKLAALYSPTDSLKIRATLEHGFRAPNLVESANSLKFAFDPGTSDPLRCAQATALANDLNAKAQNESPQQASLDNARAQAIYDAECAASIPDEVKNNPGLKPETSKSYSFGLLFEPVKGYSTSIDYWHIDRSNTIGLQSAQQLLANSAAGTVPSGSTVNRAPLSANGDPSFSSAEQAQYGVTVGPLQDIIRGMQNISEQKTSGIDVAFTTVTKLGEWGKFTTTLDGTYNLTYYDTSVSSTNENLVGSYGMPQFVSSLTFVWDYKNFANSLRYNYVGGYDLQSGHDDTTWSMDGCASINLTVDQCRVSSNRTTDYAVSYTGFTNLAINFNVINLFQQKAPTDFRAFGGRLGVIPSSLQDAQGRMLNVSVNYKFK